MKANRAFWVLVLVLFAGLGSLAAPQQPLHQQPTVVAGGNPDARLKPGMNAEDMDPDDIGFWCTSIPVSKEASADGSCMTSHSCDGHYEVRIHVMQGGKHPKGTMRPVMKGGGLGADSTNQEKKVGEIPELETTFTRFDASYPFMNEKGVQIGETTISGRRELANDEGWFDIMELERLALERASTAREAVQIMGEFATKYGYGDGGECLTVIDQNEAWHFEIFGAGPLEKGAVWAAVRIPPGHVGVSANHSRIPTLDLKNKDFYMASDNVMSVAEKMGFWKPGEPFVFYKAYGGTASLGSTRREWRVLSYMAPSLNLDPWDLELPFTVKAERKVTVQDLMGLHRDSYEGTEFDNTTGLASGPFNDPNRWPASVRQAPGMMGFERTISVIQCSYTVVLNSRGSMPAWVGAVAWFTPDDAKTGNFIPLYAGNTAVPKAFEIGNRAEFDRGSAYWAFNFVGNWARLRYNAMIADIKAKRATLEGKFIADQAEIEKQAVELYKKDPAAARKFINDYSNKAAQQTYEEWWKLADSLIVKYQDNGGRGAPGYPKEWLDSVGFGTKKIITKKPPTGPNGGQ